MKYVRLDGVKLPVSRLIFGSSYPEMWEGGPQLSDWMDTVFAYGLTTIDTAEFYGKAEEALGRWMSSRNNREQLTIITKGGHPHFDGPRCNPKCISEDIEKSLERLQTDFIDIYLLHRDDPETPVEGIIDVLNKYICAGNIGLIGVSNWTWQRIDRANRYAEANHLVPFRCNSPHYSLAEQITDPWTGKCVTFTGAEGEAERRYAYENGMNVFAYASLAHGFLSGKVRSGDVEGMRFYLDEAGVRGYMSTDNFERLLRAVVLAEKYECEVPQIALAYLLALPIPVIPIVAASREAHLRSNLRALDINLTGEECAWLNLE